MEESGARSSSSSVISAAIVSKLKKSEIFRSNPQREGCLTMYNYIEEAIEEIQCAGLSSLAEDVGTAEEQSATLSPLVFQFENPGDECVIMGMMRNGKPEVVKNEEGSESTPAFAGFIEGKGLVYGTNSKGYRGPREVWRCIDFWKPCLPKQSNQSIDLGEVGIFNLPRQFFIGFLLRKLKITAEAQSNGIGLCQVAILAVPMQIKSAQRLRLKEAALFAGFQDVYVISSEGLAAYYWFSEKKTEMEQNNFSKDFVIVDLFGHAVVYKKSFAFDSDGEKVLVVRAIILLDLSRAKDEDGFCELIQRKLKIDQMETVIPVLSEKRDFSSAFYLGSKYQDKVGMVEDDESDKFKYFVAKGAALLSETPETIGRHVQNMSGTTVRIEPGENVALPFRMLPKKCTRGSWNIEHDRAKYRIVQIGIGGRSDREVIGYLAINGLKHGTELQIRYEVSWEGIWKVVGVSSRNPSDDNEDREGFNEAVKWEWLIDNEAGFGKFGCSSYEECKLLLMKVARSPIQANVASIGLTEDASSDESSNALDGAAVTSVSSGATSSGHQSGVEQKKKRPKRLRAIRANDMVGKKTGLKKIKLESGRAVETEQDWIDDFGEGENFSEPEETQIEMEENFVPRKSKLRKKMRIFTQKS